MDPAQLDYHRYLPMFFDGIREKQVCVFGVTVALMRAPRHSRLGLRHPCRSMSAAASHALFPRLPPSLQDPYRFLAIKGVEDLLAAGGVRVLPVVPQLIIPLKTALNTRDPEVMCIALQLLAKLVACGDAVGEALVPYYRQLLPVLNIYINRCAPQWVGWGGKGRSGIFDVAGQARLCQHAQAKLGVGMLRRHVLASHVARAMLLPRYDRAKNLGDCIDYAQQQNECLGELIGSTLQLLERRGGDDAFINIKVGRGDA